MDNYHSAIKSSKQFKANSNKKKQANKVIKNTETNINDYRIDESEIKSSSNLEKEDKNFAKVSKSICKLRIETADKTINGTGFLLAFHIERETFYCLVSNEHVIKKRFLKNNIEIYVSYDNGLKSNCIKLNNNKRYIKSFTDNKLDLTFVEILEEDNIPKELFLYPESEEKINNELIDTNIFIPHYSDDKLINEKGKIRKINKYEFTHSTSNEFSSSGSPIFLENSISVIGIHKQGNLRKKLNYGNFIYPAINFIENDIRKIRNIEKYDMKDEKQDKKGDKKNLSDTKSNKYNSKILYISLAIISILAKYLLDYLYKRFFNYDKKGEVRSNFFREGEYYIGQYVNGLRNGKGIMYYSNGNIKYDGDWFNGNFEGIGKYIWEDGNYYIGEFKNCLRNGKGIEYYSNGNIRYEGEFKDDQYDGFGNYTWEDGKFCVGQFKKGIRNGKGMEYYSNGKIKYEGNFNNDKYEGKGKYIWEDGDYYMGQFKNYL